MRGLNPHRESWIERAADWMINWMAFCFFGLIFVSGVCLLAIIIAIAAEKLWGG